MSACRPLPRTAGRALAAVAVLLAGCGDGEKAPDPLRVQVTYAAVDPNGPVDGFSLVGADGRAWPLASQPALDRTVLAATAPAGRYRLVAPAGWGPVGPIEPQPLRADLSPTVFWVGRTHSLYLLNPESLPVTDAELSRGDRGTAPSAIEARVEGGADGRAALRLRPEDWSGVLHVRTRLGASILGKAVRASLSADGSPVYVTAEPALETTFDVLALPADGRPVAGLAVTGISRLGRLTARVTATTAANGWARLDPVPVDAEGFSLEVAVPGGEPAAWPAEGLRRLGEARLLLPPSASAPRGTLSVEWADPVVLLQVRPDGSATYAVPPIARGKGGADRWQVALAPGRCRVIVTDRSRSAAVVVEIGAGTETRPTLAPEAIGTVSVSLRGAFEPHQTRYDLVAGRIEDGQEVSVVGAVLRGLLRRDADLLLPAGTWRVRVVSGGREGPAKDVALTAPGSVAIALDVPR